MNATLCSSVRDCLVDFVWKTKLKTGESNLSMHLKAIIRATVSKH